MSFTPHSNGLYTYPQHLSIKEQPITPANHHIVAYIKAAPESPGGCWREGQFLGSTPPLPSTGARASHLDCTAGTLAQLSACTSLPLHNQTALYWACHICVEQWPVYCTSTTSDGTTKLNSSSRCQSQCHTRSQPCRISPQLTSYHSLAKTVNS